MILYAIQLNIIKFKSIAIFQLKNILITAHLEKDRKYDTVELSNVTIVLIIMVEKTNMMGILKIVAEYLELSIISDT